MEYLANILHQFTAGIYLFTDPQVIGYLLLGSLIGVIVGVLPGVTTVMGLAIFTPITFGMPATHAFVFLVSMYSLSTYGGSICSILVNIPGGPSNIATMWDGNPMAKKGEAGRAIGIASIADCLGGLAGMLSLWLGSFYLANLALKLHSSEYALVALMALALIAFISGENIVRGIIGGAIGLLLATVGTDLMSGYPRFTFGSPNLLGGIEPVAIMVGIFGVTEVLLQLESGMNVPPIDQKIGKMLAAFKEVPRFLGSFVRSSIIGIIIGIIPAIGPGSAAITAYAFEKKLSKHPEEWGKGYPDGVFAPECANNACIGGGLLPTLTLGIPGDAMSAVLIGALMFHGLTPGPMLYQKSPEFISAIYMTLTLSSLLILVYGFLFARPLARSLMVPKYILMPAILVLCLLGSYSINNRMFDLGITVGSGILGYFLTKLKIPMPTVALGLIIGAIFEDNLRRTLLLSDGSLMPFLNRPVSVALLIATIAIMFGPFIIGKFRKRSRQSSNSQDNVSL